MNRRNFLKSASLVGLGAGIAFQKATWAKAMSFCKTGRSDALRNVFVPDDQSPSLYLPRFEEDTNKIDISKRWPGAAACGLPRHYVIHEKTNLYEVREVVANEQQEITVPIGLLSADSEEELQHKENERIVALLDACLRPEHITRYKDNSPYFVGLLARGIPIWRASNTCPADDIETGRGMDKTFGRIEACDMTVSHVLMNPKILKNFNAKVRKERALWHADILVATEVPENKIFCLPVPEYLGAFCKYGLIFNPKSCEENVGFFILNDYLVSQFRLE